MKIRYVFLLLVVGICIWVAVGLPARSVPEGSSSVQLIDEAELHKVMYAPSPTKRLRLVNFWATWCKPCVAEMPALIELAQTYPKQIELVFVSLDHPKRIQSAQKLLSQKGVKGKHYLVDPKNQNDFINQMDPKWSGAIPFSVFIQTQTGQKVATYEAAFHKEQLFEIVDKLLADIQ